MAAGWRAWAGLVVRVYLDVVVPAAILTQAPVVLGAGWGSLVRIDVGLVLAAVVLLRLADGGVRIARTAPGAHADAAGRCRAIVRDGTVRRRHGRRAVGCGDARAWLME